MSFFRTSGPLIKLLGERKKGMTTPLRASTSPTTFERLCRQSG